MSISFGGMDGGRECFMSENFHRPWLAYVSLNHFYICFYQVIQRYYQPESSFYFVFLSLDFLDKQNSIVSDS